MPANGPNSIIQNEEAQCIIVDILTLIVNRFIKMEAILLCFRVAGLQCGHGANSVDGA